MKVSVIVPYQPTTERRAQIWEWLQARWYHGAGTLADEVEVVVAGGNPHEPFHRGKARNYGVAQSTGDVLVIADADTIPDFTLLAQAIDSLVNGYAWALPYDVYFNLNRRFSDLILGEVAPDRDITVNGHGFADHRITDAVSGMLVVPRPAWDKVGGYDLRFEGWGFEDDAFAHALEGLVGPCFRVHGDILHLWHEAPENECFGQPHIEANRRLALRYKRAIRDPEKMRALIASRP